MRGVVSIVDVQTATAFALPDRAFPPTMVTVDPLVAHDDALVFVAARNAETASLHAIQLRVPHDPAALRRWLVDITNAEPGAGGRGAVWR